MQKKHTLAKLSLVLMAAVLCAAPCLASEGVIEISQAIVEDTGGFPFTITSSGSYRLTTNLSVPSDSGIVVEAGDVTIDLNGFSIVGTGGGAAKGLSGRKGFVETGGIRGEAGTTVRVLNGAVSGFPVGILLRGLANEVKMVTAHSNGVGMVVWPSESKGGPPTGQQGGTIENCKAFDNLDGMHGFGITVTDFVATDNEQNGINCQDCSITNSLLTNNGNNGIECSDCKIRDSRISGNGTLGIGVENGGLVTGNTIISGVEKGFGVEGAMALEGNVGWSNNVIVDEALGMEMAMPKGSEAEEIGGYLIGCNLVNTELFCPDFFDLD